MDGLRMMTYKEANSILNSALSPNNRCIARSTAEKSQSIFKDFFTRNGFDENGSGYLSNRLIPVEALNTNPGMAAYNHPFDDMDTMYLYWSENDPEYPRKGYVPAVSHSGYSVWTYDSIAAGYTYTLQSIEYDNDADKDWLAVDMINLENYYKNDDYADIIFYGGVQYSVTENNTGKERKATLTFTATKQDEATLQSIISKVGGGIIADDIKSPFVVTIRQRSALGPQSDADASFNNANSVSIDFGSSDVQLAVTAGSYFGYSGYWSDQGIVGSILEDYQGLVSVSGSSISISPTLLNDLLHREHNDESEYLYVYANWKSSPGGTVSVTASSGSESKTFDVDGIYSAGSLNMTNADVDTMRGWCSCVMRLSLTIINVNQPNESYRFDVEVLSPGDSYYNAGIRPVLTASEYSLFGGSDRDYEAKGESYNMTVESSITETVNIHSDIDGSAKGYTISINADDDNSTYTINGSQSLTAASPVHIDASAVDSSFTILFDSSNVGIAPVTRRFKLEQDDSPEYITLQYTFNTV